MIQTQLLRLDPPYQIISARGYVGIQVATLIVTEERESPHRRLSSFSSSYYVCHSYPVVNYGLKEGLDELMKYNNSPIDDYEQYQIRRRMQPEGAVWDGVDVKDVRVLGLAGAKNESIELVYFVYLIPTVRGYDPYLHIWDKNSTSRLFNLYTGLGNVGLRTHTLMANTYRMPDGEIVDERNEYRIRLTLENNVVKDGYCIKVLVKEDISLISGEDNSIYFRCIVDPSNESGVNESVATIVEGLHGISPFLPTLNIKLVADNDLKDSEGSDTGFMKQLISQIKDNYKIFR